jgi:hypothetical protein
MKKLLTLLVAAAFVMPVMAADEKAAPETKKVCVDVQGKDGKPVIDPKTKQPKQQCTTVKVRKKHEGTKIEDAKKK